MIIIKGNCPKQNEQQGFTGTWKACFLFLRGQIMLTVSQHCQPMYQATLGHYSVWVLKHSTDKWLIHGADTWSIVDLVMVNMTNTRLTRVTHKKSADVLNDALPILDQHATYYWPIYHLSVDWCSADTLTDCWLIFCSTVSVFTTVNMIQFSLTTQSHDINLWPN